MGEDEMKKDAFIAFSFRRILFFDP